jgi:hypothetical protein
MRRLSQAELLTATALDKESLKTLRRRDQVALAFARRHCYESLGYVALDAAAIMLADTLTKTYGRDTAAQIVRVHCDKWAEAIALYEIDSLTDGVFAVGDFEIGNGQDGHLAVATNTKDMEVIAQALKSHPAAFGHNLYRITTVDMAPLIQFVQNTGEAHDIRLYESWAPPHGSREFAELFASYADERDAAIEKISAKRMEKVGDKARAIFEQMAVMGGIN